MNPIIEYEYDNLILIAHAKDETIFFYDYITHNSLVVLLTKPSVRHDNEVLNDVIIKKGASLAYLDEIESFETDYELENRSKSKLSSIMATYDFERIITHGAVSKKSDPQNRALFDYTKSLKLKNHYVLNYGETSNKK